MTTQVITEVNSGVGWIKLNRQRALNSLNVEMVEAIYKQLIKWKTDDRIAIVCIYGEGDKGLCAGGDMRKLYDLKDSDVESYAKKFFTTEYAMDFEIHQYSKPVVVYMNGIVMGGGVGLSFGASHRIVTETTKWAMPEMNIGFFPDVGASYFLNQMPGYIGRYLALTSESLKATDVIHIGAADYYLESEKWDNLRETIKEKTWQLDSAYHELNNLLKSFCTSPIPSSMLAVKQEQINKHFDFQTVENIVSSLNTEKIAGDPWVKTTLDTMLSKPPTSLKVSLRQLQLGKQKSLKECFEMELNLAMNFMDFHDFYEGVRAVLVDKDRKPMWNPCELVNIAEDQIASFFNYDWSKNQNPLSQVI